MAAFARGPALLYALMISGSFGTLQMLPGSGGGANLLPQSVCAVLFVAKVLAQPGNFTRAVEAALDPRRLALFSAFLVYSVVGALVLPRLFAGVFEVVPVSAFSFGTDILRPSSGNFTQSCYMALSYATTLCFSIIGQSEAMREHFRRALLYAALGLVGTGLLDLVTYTLHIGSLLDPFRTASYSLLIDVEADGAKRVVGLMPEASTYGTACVGILSLMIFMRPLYRAGNSQAMALVAIAALSLMSMLSTSATAIVGIGVMGGVYAFDLLARMIDPTNLRRAQLNIEISLIVVVAFALAVSLVVNPSMYDPVVSLVDKMVFQKASSASYAERSLWNRVGWEAFLDSGGIGAGLGSIRVSNWAISILGSTGVLGAILMFGFIVQQLVTVSRTAPVMANLFAMLLKIGLLPTLIMYQLAGTIPDIGITAAAALGLIAAAHTPTGRTTSSRQSSPGKLSLAQTPSTS
ncbi:hypothetical protein [Methylobacterium sp. J-067]|uniref:hypothetical protein n=1 Tax=Methylobacterium sp. J-067 TaxID=2836648 RepID=UPI001FB9B5ED|nr:hypothetical protein [Methylobacterium sp. J-067]MCJ2023081.1 hypothetical protein [Methylobacterium sp. J-067]